MRKLNAFRLDANIENILSDKVLGSSKTSVLEELLADGLKYRMMEYHKPVSRKFLDRLTADGVFRCFCEFMDAVARESGTESRYAVQGKFRLEPCPANSKFYDGHDCYLVLSEREFVRGDGAIVREID